MRWNSYILTETGSAWFKWGPPLNFLTLKMRAVAILYLRYFRSDLVEDIFEKFTLSVFEEKNESIFNSMRVLLPVVFRSKLVP